METIHTLYNYFYCAKEHFFHPDTAHCELCFECIITGMPQHCLSLTSDLCCLPRHNSILSTDQIKFTMDGEHWQIYSDKLPESIVKNP